MSRANPRKAIAALIPPAQAVIRPMTLGMYAALERIGSPLVTGEETDTLGLIPSLYLLTHDPLEVFRGNILDLSMKWADSQPVDAMSRIREAADRQMQAFYAVIPQTKKKTTKAMTAGSRTSSTGRRDATGGAIGKSCGKSRRARSGS